MFRRNQGSQTEDCKMLFMNCFEFKNMSLVLIQCEMPHIGYRYASSGNVRRLPELA